MQGQQRSRRSYDRRAVRSAAAQEVIRAAIHRHRSGIGFAVHVCYGKPCCTCSDGRKHLMALSPLVGHLEEVTSVRKQNPSNSKILLLV